MKKNSSNMGIKKRKQDLATNGSILTNETKKKRQVSKKKVTNNKSIERKKSIKGKDVFEIQHLPYIYILLQYFFDHTEVNIYKDMFYMNTDIFDICENLVGCILWVYEKEENKLYASRLVEIEAYNGIEDKGSHAYNNKKTNRNLSMFKKGGISYVYICYGIHYCLNIVTNDEEYPDAILIRSTEPIYSVHWFLKNKKTKMVSKDIPNNTSLSYSDILTILQEEMKNMKKKNVMKLCSGPGCVTKCMNITKQDDSQHFYFQDSSKSQIDIKKEKVSVCFKSRLNNLGKSSRFFISECPSSSNIVHFFESMIQTDSTKGEREETEEKFIKEIYCTYKSFLMAYFDYMKWDKDQIITQKDKRIGIDSREEAVFYEYRYLLKNHPSVTFPPK